jgi:hypothetical protein
MLPAATPQEPRCLSTCIASNNHVVLHNILEKNMMVNRQVLATTNSEDGFNIIHTPDWSTRTSTGHHTIKKSMYLVKACARSDDLSIARSSNHEPTNIDIIGSY